MPASSLSLKCQHQVSLKCQHQVSPWNASIKSLLEMPASSLSLKCQHQVSPWNASIKSLLEMPASSLLEMPASSLSLKCQHQVSPWNASIKECEMEKHQNLSLWKWIDEEIVFYCQMYVNNGNLLQKLTEKVTKIKYCLLYYKRDGKNRTS
jgi:hypothetical protein